MARRYTDTEKWKDDWYLCLSNDWRIVWQYIIDNCTIAGVWKKAFRSLNYFCNTNITEEEFIKVFAPRVIDCGSFFFIPKFLKFQYPLGLTSDKPLIVSVMKEVSFLNLSVMIVESLGNDYPIIKVTGKGNVKRKKVNGKKDNTVNDESKKNNEQELVYPFNTTEFLHAWGLWKQFKKEQFSFTYKSPLSEQAALSELSTLSNGNELTALAVIHQSIAKGWQGLFQLKNKSNGTHQSLADYAAEVDRAFNERFPAFGKN